VCLEDRDWIRIRKAGCRAENIDCRILDGNYKNCVDKNWVSGKGRVC